jgi:hypothetical protein
MELRLSKRIHQLQVNRTSKCILAQLVMNPFEERMVIPKF